MGAMFIPKIVLILLYAHSPQAQSFGFDIPTQAQTVTYYAIEIQNQKGLVVAVKGDGGVVFGPGFAGDAAAREFWKAVAREYTFSCQAKPTAPQIITQ